MTLTDTEIQSPLSLEIQSVYGTYLGRSIAKNAERYLRNWGFNPHEFEKISRNHNVSLFKCGNFAIKIKNGIETHQQSPLESNPVILKALASANIGYDMGQVPVELEIFPFLDTTKVEPRHIRTLCHELYTKYNLVFRDNKLENVGLTESGLPYVIDSGSIIHKAMLKETGTLFHYPELSGYNGSGAPWHLDATSHSFNWPDPQTDLPEFGTLAAAIKDRKSIAAIT